MRRLTAWPLTLAAAALLPACTVDTSPPSPSVSVVAAAPVSVVLRNDQVPGYVHSSAGSITVTPELLAQEAGDQKITAALAGEGFQRGARVVFVPANQTTPTPFLTILDQVMFFDDAAGATSYLTAELTRQQAPGSSGTPVSLPVQRGSMDQVAGLSFVDTRSGRRGFLALMRRGRAVVTLFTGGEGAGATNDEFNRLVSAQEEQLAGGTI
jgi:hypothetical protein